MPALFGWFKSWKAAPGAPIVCFEDTFLWLDTLSNVKPLCVGCFLCSTVQKKKQLDIDND